MRVVECAVCGLAYLNPRPRADLVPDLYRDDYFTGVSAQRGEGGLKANLDISASGQSEEVGSSSRAIEIIIERSGGLPDKDILEIGCATGDLLSEMKKAGGRTKGLEISGFASDIARKRGLDIFTGTVEGYIAGPHEQFDVVAAFEVIEHVLSPVRFLKSCSDLIRPGGLLILSTPNYGCARRYKAKWTGFNSSYEHLYFFSKESIEKMVERFNMRVTYWETSKHPGRMPLNREKIRRIIHRIYYLRSLAKQFGLAESIKIFAGTFGTIFYPYGTGHTLTLVIEKTV